MTYRIDFESLEWEAPQAGTRSKAFRFGIRQLRLAEYTDQMEPHWCEKGHVGCILEGQLEVKFDDQVVEFGAGDGVVILPGPRHRHMARVISGPVRALFVEDA
jgi:quercetin dioxygenase-like cupin family protein